MGMVFKNIEYMNGGCFENLSGTSVPKSIGRGPPGLRMPQSDMGTGPLDETV
jgi:hypothetical protein